VKRGDSLWSIAEAHLGAGIRYTELAELNATVLHGRPGFLLPGTQLRLPAKPEPDATEDDGHRLLVQRGDTLSKIAEEQLGDADRYPDIFHASTFITQPGGQHLTDPDVIDVGWTLTIPATDHPRGSKQEEEVERKGHKANQRPPHVERHRDQQPPPAPPRPVPSPPAKSPTPRIAPTPESSTPASPAPASSAPTSDSTAREPAADADQAEPAAPGWMLTGLTGGGVVLAGSILIALRRRRNQQARHRRPGRTLPMPPPDLAPVEKTVTLVGDTARPTLERMDTLLRRLAAAQTAAAKPMPVVTTVELTQDTISLHLDDPCHLPTPWRSDPDQLHWKVDHTVYVDEVGPDVADQPAPYPLLVTVGATEAGDVWLLNLEHAGIVSITGDPVQADDFARYLAAELACNPWSAGVTLDCLGVADEVKAMNPESVRLHALGTDPAAEVLSEASIMVDRAEDAGTDLPTARAHQHGPDAWPARILMADLSAAAPASLDRLLSLMRDHPGLTGTSVILTHAEIDHSGITLRLTDGRLSLPGMGLNLRALGLTHDEAVGCAALLAQADTDGDALIPDTADAEGWRGYANQAGALRAEHTIPRDTAPADLPEPADTLLPGPDNEYVAAAATTEKDLAALAPQVPVRLRAAVEDADPTLDNDLATWLDPDCNLPRLTLLGPVGAQTRGTAIAKRKPYYTELLAYLATRPHGATPDEVAEAFTITGPRVRNDIKVLRDWLGTNPRTGRKHLPDARESAAAQARGIGVYQVEGLLVDADLFRRLRVRGETRGPDGITDLRAALKLVAGQPFDKLRPGGWAWLYDGDRLDQHLICAIVDVAHLVTTHSLHNHELPVARAAAEIAALAAPHEEIPRLDLAAVAEAAGHHRQAHSNLRADVYNRSDDGQPPVELSERTQHIINSRKWLLNEKTAS
jgi:hypothetical protein